MTTVTIALASGVEIPVSFGPDVVIAGLAASRAEAAALRAEAVPLAAARGLIYGLDGAIESQLFAGESVEMEFREGFYRDGLIIKGSATDLPGWDFSREGISSGLTEAGSLRFFPSEEPRITNRGMLVEAGTGVNDFLYSEDFTNAAWTKALATVVPNVDVGPRGDGTMEKIIATGTGVHYVRQLVTGVSTASFYAKAGSLGWCAIEFAKAGGGFPIVYFDLATGEVGNKSVEITARIDRASRGAWRISASIANVDAAVSVYLATGNGGASFVATAGPFSGGFIYLDMAQSEPNARPNSYIGTQGATASRGPDTPSIALAPAGDFTIYAEAELRASSAKTETLFSLTAADPSIRIAVYRNSVDIMAVQVGDGAGLAVAGGPTYADARIVRAAISVTASQVRACFDGGTIFTLNTPRPEGLEQLWLGLISGTIGDGLDGFVRSVVARERASSDAFLQTITQPGDRMPVAAANGADIEQALIAHANDTQPHDLEALRRTIELVSSTQGLAQVAADTFTGADGALTNAETGGQPWVAIGGNPLDRVAGVATSPDNALRGTYLADVAADGQVEADLTPGTLETSLYFRYQSNGNYLMFQRGSDGAAGLIRFIGGATSAIAPTHYQPVVAGERWKIRFVGPRIWVFRVVDGVEEMFFEATETQWQTAGGAGIRINGTGTVDNFRVLKKEAI